MRSATSNPLAGDWDVVVIGAGPAGAVAARGTATGGARTLLVERKTFPRSKVCGACLNRPALETLERIGLSATIGRLGGVPLQEFHVRSGGRGLTLPLPAGLALSRSRFDAALVAAAVAAGANFRPETTATVGPPEPGPAGEFRQLTLRDGAGAMFVTRARVVIAADGLGHSSLDSLPEFASRVAPTSRIGIGGALREFPAEYRPGTIHMAVGRAGYVGLVRVEEGALNVAAAIAPEFVRAQGSVPAALAATLAEGGLPPLERIEDTAWHGTLPLTRTSPIVAGQRILLVGDAAGYVEPFTGEGMAWALAGACAVEPFVLRGISKWDGALEQAWTQEHRSLIARRQRWCRWLSALLRHPRLARAVLSVVARAPPTGATGRPGTDCSVGSREGGMGMRLHLWGVGTALPPFGIDQADAAEIARRFHCRSEDQQRLLPILYRRAGVKRRYSVVLEADSGPLDSRQSFFPDPETADDRGPTTGMRMDRFDRDSGAIAAAASRKALADAGIGPEAVTHLITVTCSGFSAPGFDVALIRDLPLGADTSRTQIGFMGCHGALNALRVARGFAAGDPNACILICCVELCSLHHHYGWDPDQIVAGALFADGAAAVVCRGRAREQPGGWHVDDNGATIVADTTDAMGWRIRDHGFEMNLSPRVPELIHRHLRPWLETWLSRNGLGVEQVASWAIHPGGPRIVSACGEALGLGAERLQDSSEILQECGNMSSPTILFILDRLRRRNAPAPGVMLGFGPGLAIEAALLRR